ncbi:MAG TPA: NADH-quinone oxidoreductase subunit J [Bdellovibrionota bacterium]|nr:NADH-quinone oxidoreductase subunit J [Bdellovibrionota bacterium]
MENILFYIVATLSIVGALSVILNRNPVYSALSLVGFLFVQAILYVLLKAYFIAAVQVLVYAGAIMVLFVYVVMVMKLSSQSIPKIGLHPFSIFLAGIFGTALFYLFTQNPLKEVTGTAQLTGEIKNIGQLLFSEYVLPFEVISLLLIVAMVGAVILNQKRKEK